MSSKADGQSRHPSTKHLHRTKLLPKQVKRQTGASLVHEEHVEDRELDDRLVRGGADSVQSAGKVPLCCAVELSLPNHRCEDEKRRDQEHRSAANLHSERNPEDVGESL